jgi:predicted DNA-binding protein (MmcQ/YjbR family)
MDVESLRTYLLSFPAVTETMQWGDNLVYWVADKAIGGKMFALANLSPKSGPVLAFSAGPERFAELLEREGIFPAPYLARAHWVALERWDALPASELKELLAHARNRVYDKLPRRTKDVLALPPAARGKLIAERKKLLAPRSKNR